VNFEKKLAGRIPQGDGRIIADPAERSLKDTRIAQDAPQPYAKQTISNRLKAFIGFNMMPFYRGYNFDKWDRIKGFPMPRNPSLSIDDGQWRIEHAEQMRRGSNIRPLRTTDAA
jgi:hypothetical protein